MARPPHHRQQQQQRHRHGGSKTSWRSFGSRGIQCPPTTTENSISISSNSSNSNRSDSNSNVDPATRHVHFDHVLPTTENSSISRSDSNVDPATRMRHVRFLPTETESIPPPPGPAPDLRSWTRGSPAPPAVPQAAVTDAEEDTEDTTNTYHCYLCLEDLPVFSFVSPSDICHPVCTDCLRSILDHSLTTSMLPRCGFAGCKELINDSVLRPILTEADLPKYTRMRSLRSNENVRECPNADCSHLQEGNPESPEMICTMCNLEYCFFHSTAHAGKKCKGLSKSIGRDGPTTWMWKKCFSQKCPSCKRQVERNGGCPHMTCLCGAQFCYLCGVDWSKTKSSHASPFNFRPSACKGGRVMAMRAGIAVAALPVVAVGVAVSPFIGAVFAGKKIKQYRRQRKMEAAARARA